MDDDEIAQLCDKCNHLYNSVSYDVDKMNNIGVEINRQIKEHAYIISVEDVIEGVQRLKLGKLDGEDSDHIYIVREYSVLLTSLIVCSYMGIALTLC